MVTKPKQRQYATPEALGQLEAMGFSHQDQSRAALEAALGNVDLAVEFLMNGIPDDPPQQQRSSQPPAAALRSHLKFDEVRRAIQRNPENLTRVLEQLGRDNPELLQLINAHQSEFLRLVNETAPAEPEPQPAEDIARAMASITPAQRAQLAAQIGLTPEQVEQFARQMQSMPREQIRQLFGSFRPQQNVVRLTREEAEAVGRLAELGFSRDDAAQAYLVCEKNEALAANLLFDGFETNGNNFQLDDDDAGGGQAPPPEDDDDDDDDDAMYS